MRKILTLLIAALGCCAQAQPLAAAPATPPPVAPAAEADSDPAALADAAILQMSEAARKGDQARLSALLPLARGHALEPWAAYWELKARLPTASAEEVDAFLARWSGTYQQDRLRADWLRLLGQRRDWARFAAYEKDWRMRDESQIHCYSLALAHMQDKQNVSAEVARLWLAQKPDDDACLFAASRLAESGLLPAEVVWRKAGAAVLAGQVKLARAAVSLLHPEAADQVQALNDKPARWLAGKAPAGIKPPELRRALITLALMKLVWADPAAARQYMPQWGRQLDAAERDRVWAAAGRKAALRLLPEAAAYYAQVSQPAALDDETRAWMVRAFLRAGRWGQVLRTIDAMPAAQAVSPVWTYWRARALQAQGRSEQARAIYQSVARASGGSYYQKLAAEALGQRLTASPAAPPVAPAESEAARNHPGLNRALIAIALGLRNEGVREWNYSVNLHTPGGMGEGLRHAVAERACQYQVWDRCISDSERLSFADPRLRFPTPHRQQVQAHAQAAGLETAYVYGLIRQESRFVTNARSRVGASGLMQIMPATARWTARRLGLQGFQPDQINELETNLLIGTHYLKLALERFGGALPLAAAAYNAGPARVRQWRAPEADGRGPELEGAIWIENIPFDETRIYVQNVLSNTVDYAAGLTGQPQSLAARLGRVAPPSAEEDAAANAAAPASMP